MGDTIFVMDANGQLVSMQPSDYDAEEVLQRLLSEHPELLPLSSSDGPTRWLLVAREAGIPDDSGVDRFALDHLLLDAEGVPTLVEVKRSSDSRIRREVVGQMLDYASHFVIHWTSERVRSTYEATCATLEVDPDERLATLIGQVADSEVFWQRVKTNLLARRIRLLFVADRIPPELRRVVEFLNAVTDPVEVLAVEIPQYTGQGLTTFVPRVIGQTVAAQEKKSGADRPKRKWDETTFFATLGEYATEAEVLVARRLLEWAQTKKLDIWWGEGTGLGSFIVRRWIGDTKHFLFSVFTNSTFSLMFREMSRREPFADLNLRRELQKLINVQTRLNIPEAGLSRQPTFPLLMLTDPATLSGFINSWDWYLGTISRTSIS